MLLTETALTLMLSDHCGPATYVLVNRQVTASVVKWSEFMDADPEVPGSITGTSGFSEK
jgi:hypothetical protein